VCLTACAAHAPTTATGSGASAPPNVPRHPARLVLPASSLGPHPRPPILVHTSFPLEEARPPGARAHACVVLARTREWNPPQTLHPPATPSIGGPSGNDGSARTPFHAVAMSFHKPSVA
jgi:hypothetical protein